MKREHYYWIAIGVLVISTGFFWTLAQIQSNYAMAAMEEVARHKRQAEEQQRRALEHIQQAEMQVKLAETRSAEQEESAKEISRLSAEPKECKASK